MRYFFHIKYSNSNTSYSANLLTVIIVDEKSNAVKLFPGRVSYSDEKSVWLTYYNKQKLYHINKEDAEIYKICENQYKKFVDKGIVPINWDW